MKILYMGTPDFAIKPLEKLIYDGHEIVGVITREDKPKGRGMKVLMTPVKEFAITQNIPVFQPTSVKDGALSGLLSELSPEIICVVAYGKILPSYILDFPKYGCVNLHGSLLPKYRGSAPIQRAVLNGDKITGVTTMLMNEGMDTGDILEVAETPISSEDTSESVFERLSEIGAELLSSTVAKLSRGELTPIPQNEAEATYAPPIRKEEAHIDWSKSAEEIMHLILGSFSWPIAYTESKIGRIKVYSAEIGPACKNPAGEVVSLSKEGLMISAGDELSVVIKLFQVENSKRMSPEDYFRGHESIIGTSLS